MDSSGPIVLLTDFGLQDAYVGIMKGVIAGIAPRSPVIDLTHGIPHGDIPRAAFHLWQSAGFFPQTSIFVVVVDPGVGTARRGLGAAWPTFSCFAPDNGVLTYLCERSEPIQIVELAAEEYRLPGESATFHGRDVFAPAAAHLAAGVSLTKLGPPLKEIVRCPLPRLLQESKDSIGGQILFADHFGNLITSIGLLHNEAESLVLDPWLSGCPPARFPRPDARLLLPDGRQLAISRTFGDVDHGEPVAYISSSGLLEIAVNQGSAEALLGLSAGQEISLIRKG